MTIKLPGKILQLDGEWCDIIFTPDEVCLLPEEYPDLIKECETSGQWMPITTEEDARHGALRFRRIRPRALYMVYTGEYCDQ